VADNYPPPLPQYTEPQLLLPAYPQQVSVAGIIWIIAGSVVLLQMVIVLLLTFVISSDAKVSQEQGALITTGVCTSLLLGLVGGVFVHVGVQSLRGTAKDTLGNAIGSVFFAVILIASAITQMLGANRLQASANFLAGGGLMFAGTLALVGRGRYKAWRKAIRQYNQQQLPPPFV
jgi:hypothetical protein